MRHLLSPLDFSVEELDNLMDLIEANPKKYAHACEAKHLPLFSMNRAHVPD